MTAHAPDPIPTHTDIADVRPFVPHRDHMLWLERIERVDAHGVHASCVIQNTSLFVRGQQLPIWACVEYMAQTVAVWAGNQAHDSGQAAKVGFLLGTRKFEVFRQAIAVGERLDIHAHLELQAENGLGMFSCEVWVSAQLAAKAQLSVYQPPDAP